MANSFITASLIAGQNVGDNLTRYSGISGQLVMQATQSWTQTPIRDGGTFSKLFAYVSANTNTGNSTITLSKSLTATTLTVTYGSTQTGIKEDTSNSVLFANTDEANWIVFVPNTGAATSCTFNLIACQFAPTTTTDCISFLAVNSSSTVANSAVTEYLVPSGDTVAENTATEANCKFRIRGTFISSDFYTNISTNARTSTTTFLTRKNGANGAQSVAYTSTQTGIKEDTSNSDSLAAGDDFCYAVTTTGAGAQSLTFKHWSSSIISTNSEFIFLSGLTPGASIAANSTAYIPPSGDVASPSATEANVQAYPQFTFTAKEFGSFVTTNTSIVLSTVFTVRDNGANGNGTVTYTAGQTGLKNDSVNTDTITSGTDEIDYSILNNDLTGVTTVSWVGLVGVVSAAATATIHRMMLMGAT